MLKSALSSDPDTAEPLPGGEAARAQQPDTPSDAAIFNDLPHQRHGYQPPRSSRIFGGIGTASIIPAILLVALITLNESHHHRAAAAPLSVSMVPIDTPKIEPAKTEPQRPVPKQTQPVQPQIVAPPPIVTLPQPAPPLVVATRVPDPKPVEAKPSAPPPTPAAPPVPAPASHGPDRWEGRVLARLERFRHYPSEAQRARQQGTTVVRFKLDRGGHVLSSSIERSSGNAALDQAAMETLQRADPLPKIPADRPDVVELIVPIEFSLSR